MSTKTLAGYCAALALVLAVSVPLNAPARMVDKDKVYDTGTLPARDSEAKVAVGDVAPGFTLPAVSGGTVSLSDYKGEKNVLISFVPAAWTPVCSQQWPGYNLAREIFEKHDTVILGVTTDNIPTLYAWTREMGDLWFPVLSDFWPHGAAAEAYGVLRSDGTAERALILVDKQGKIRYMDVHDINQRPDLGVIAKELGKLDRPSP